MGFNIGSALSGAFQGLAESGGNPLAAVAGGAISALGGSGGAGASASSATSGSLGSLGLGALDNIVAELAGGSAGDPSVNALSQLAGTLLGTGGAQPAAAGSASGVAPDTGITVPQPSTSAQSTFRSFSSMQPPAQGGDTNAQLVGDPGDAGGADGTSAA